MIILLGERTRAKAEAIGAHQCGVCKSQQEFTEQTESSWFCFFGLPLLRVEQLAAFWRCERCLSAYESEQTATPTAVEAVKWVVQYILLGYGYGQQHKVAASIVQGITGFDIDQEESARIQTQVSAGNVDVAQFVKKFSATTNMIGKQQIVEAAFLATHVCCDIEYADRLRVNLVGSALGIGLEFVNYAIEQTRKQGYYGVRRLASDNPSQHEGFDS